MSKNLKIAIIGSGLAGLATAWMLSQNKNYEITVFEDGTGASKMAAGLMHPFAGGTASLNPNGYEAYQLSLELFEIASKALEKKVYQNSGLLRLAISDLQQKRFKLSAEKNREVLWQEPHVGYNNLSYVESYPALYIPSAVSINCSLYLAGLKKALEEKGVKTVYEKVEQLKQLQSFDKIIVAAGKDVKNLLKETSLPIHLNKGQLLKILWPKQLPILPFPINSSAYLMMQDEKYAIGGATYEKHFTHEEVDIEYAKHDILPKLGKMIKDLKDAEVVDCKAGIRVSCPGHLPFIAQVDEKTFVFTGLGSKGLLYHAFYAKKLVGLFFGSDNGGNATS